MPPDLKTAYDVIDMYAERHLEKPDETMTKSRFRLCSQQMQAVDILKSHLKAHWFEAPASDIIYNFVKEHHRRMLKSKSDSYERVIYLVSKEIFYYFV